MNLVYHLFNVILTIELLVLLSKKESLSDRSNLLEDRCLMKLLHITPHHTHEMAVPGNVPVFYILKIHKTSVYRIMT